MPQCRKQNESIMDRMGYAHKGIDELLFELVHLEAEEKDECCKK